MARQKKKYEEAHEVTWFVVRQYCVIVPIATFRVFFITIKEENAYLHTTSFAHIVNEHTIMAEIHQPGITL